MPRVTDLHAPSFLTLRNLRLLSLVVGAVGVLWGVIETLVALEVLSADSWLSPIGGRTGWGIGVGMLAIWLLGVGGVVVANRYPAAASILFFCAGSGGFLLVGAPWLMPGIFLSVASWLALLAVKNPFEEEMVRERQQIASRSPDAP
jgi:hypothetical protein